MMPILLSAANHSFHNNADFYPFQFHPVLGFIDAVVAVRYIHRGSEVRVFFLEMQCSNNYECNGKVYCNYRYSPLVFQATGIFHGELECSSVSAGLLEEDENQDGCSDLSAH